jgi:DNA-binding transcriptional MerR regulator
MDVPGSYTVDQLAQAAGMNTSTIRLYRQRGLLPAPRMVGRVGYFDDGHLARLRLITELQERRFSLAGIKQLVDSWEAGRNLDAVLGLERSLVHGSELEPISRAALEARFPELAREPALLDRMSAADIIVRSDDGEIHIRKGFLDTAALLSSLGISLPVMLDEFEPVQAFADATARRFVALFEQYAIAAGTIGDPEALAPMIAALRDAGVGVVAGALSNAIDRAAAEAVARHLDGAGRAASVN